MRFSVQKLVFFILLNFIGISFTLAQNTSYEKFGKARVQYKRFYWSNYKTENFDIYFYDGGARLANFAARFLETEFNKITDVLGYTPYSKSRIFIYTSISDMQQSNIGLDKEQVSVGGKTNFFNSQAEIPYTGSIEDFKKELLFGVSYMYINEMVYGGSLKEALQSTYTSSFSEWFLAGAASYVANGWSEEMDDRMRDMFSSRRNVKKPSLLSGEEALFAGQAIWNFIAEKYGKGNVSNILNLARIIRNERNSIASTLGVRYKPFLKDWEAYYDEITKMVIESADDPVYDFKLRKRNKKNRIFNNIKLSPDGSKVAYSENINGRYKVVVKDLERKKRKVMFRTGYNAIYQRPDYKNPTLGWQNNENLGIMHNKKGSARLDILNMKKKKQFEKSWASINQVHSFDFSDDGNFLVISGDIEGQSNYKTGQNELFIYDFEIDFLNPLNIDWADDLNPSFLPNSNEAFVFSSNRESDTLAENMYDDWGPFDKNSSNYDLFIYDPQKSKTNVQRITNGVGTEKEPMMLDENNLLYLNDDNGIFQLYKYNLATGKTNQITNHRQSINNYDVNYKNSSIAFLMLDKHKYYPFYKADFNFENEARSYKSPRAELLDSRYSRTKNQQTIVIKTDTTQKKVDSLSVKKNQGYAEDEVDTDNYEFEPEIVKQEQTEVVKAQNSILNTIRNANKKEIRVIGAYKYEPVFRTEGITTSFYMDPLRGFGIVLNLSTADLLEDHKVRGGLLGITDLRSASYFLEYQYLGRRLDYTARYERSSIFLNRGSLIQRYSIDKFELGLGFPFTNTMRVALTPFAATTKYTNLNRQLLSQPENRINYLGGRVDFVFDNTVVNGMNMMSGTRFKMSYENYNAIGEALKSFYTFTADFRTYFRLHKDIVLATRLTFGSSGGYAPKRFLVGGMDNWMGNQSDNTGQGDALETAPDQDNSDLLFVRYVTNMRGFNYNKISGNNFLLGNLELRIPIIKYLFGKRINNNFLKNLMFVGFTDIGSAWTDGNPFTRENSINTRTVGNPSTPFTATVINFKNPFLFGYGFGARTFLLGYYLKLDLAWSVEDYVPTKEPKIYVSFGYDF